MRVVGDHRGAAVPAPHHDGEVAVGHPPEETRHRLDVGRRGRSGGRPAVGGHRQNSSALSMRPTTPLGAAAGAGVRRLVRRNGVVAPSPVAVVAVPEPGGRTEADDGATGARNAGITGVRRLRVRAARLREHLERLLAGADQLVLLPGDARDLAGITEVLPLLRQGGVLLVQHAELRLRTRPGWCADGRGRWRGTRPRGSPATRARRRPAGIAAGGPPENDGAPPATVSPRRGG